MTAGSEDEIVIPELTDPEHKIKRSRKNLCPLGYIAMRFTSDYIFRETKDFLELKHIFLIVQVIEM